MPSPDRDHDAWDRALLRVLVDDDAGGHRHTGGLDHGSVELDVVVELDAGGRIRRWNARAARNLGHGDEIVGAAVDVLFAAGHDDRGHVQQRLEHARVHGRARGDAWLLRADGSQLRAAVVLVALRGDDGTVLGFVVSIRDRSELHQAQQRAQQSEERFTRLVEQAPFSIQVFAPDGTTLRVNRAWEELWGVRLDQIPGYNVLADAQLEAKGVLPYVREAFAGRAARLPSIEYDPRQTTPGIEHVGDPRRWLSAIVFPIKDAAGVVREVVLIHEDDTARKRADDELRASEARLEAVLAGIHDHLVCYDRQWRYTFVNDRAAEMLGHTKQQLLGRSIWDVFPGAVGNQYHRELHMALAQQRVVRSEHYYPPFATWYENHIYPTPEGLTVFSADVTWRKQLEAELRQQNERLADADRRKDEFLATLAHELRNPLAPLRNSLQILRLPHVDAETARRTRDVMERQVSHLARLVDDLLDVSRVMRGKIALRCEPVELAAVVARGVETAQPLVEVQGHTLEIAVPDEPLPVFADPVRMAQVVANLLANAAKYTDARGRITITARRDGEHAVLTVRDNGIGIAAAMLPQVFDLFVQADHSSSRAQGGLGIGLTLVRSLVEMHDGTVAASSAGLGHGSEFVVRLPLLSTTGADAAAGTATAPPVVPAPVDVQPPVPGARRLLVVDDNEDAASSLALWLQLRGHEVFVAHSGPAALRAVREHRPDVVFLDLGMPGMDGFEVARRLRERPELAGVRLVALTGWGQDDDRRRTAAAGFDHHLVKPADPAVLERLLADAVDERV